VQFAQSVQAICKRIRNLAEQKEVSIKNVLAECDIGGSWLSDMERRGKHPTADRLLAIAEYFGVTTDYLLTGKETRTGVSKQKTEEIIMTPRVIHKHTGMLALQYCLLAEIFDINDKDWREKNDKIESLAKDLNTSKERVIGFLEIAYDYKNYDDYPSAQFPYYDEYARLRLISGQSHNEKHKEIVNGFLADLKDEEELFQRANTQSQLQQPIEDGRPKATSK